jgi:phosphonate degradation associated HDIG domain protein
VKAASSVTEVLSLYERFGADHYDETLSQIDHALQTAALAEAARAGDALIGAALLHDVGHLLHLRDTTGSSGDIADLHHEATGARYLAGLFGADVVGPIALHVRAKRYRCAVDPSYDGRLSAGSRASLAKQGGPLSGAEAAAFETLAACAEAVQLREWDDLGKVHGLRVPELGHYRELLDALSAPDASG